jgi:hypothetical protein
MGEELEAARVGEVENGVLKIVRVQTSARKKTERTGGLTSQLDRQSPALAQIREAFPHGCLPITAFRLIHP